MAATSRKRRQLLRIPGAQQVNRGVYRRAPEITLFTTKGSTRCIAAQQAQKDGLQDIFRVRSVTGNTVGRAEYQPMICLKNSIELG